ncbi:MAG: BirA family transcriptional regulator [Acetobacteraceae bacterium]|jgi:BirA family biotin operon repressor/biotin-[acetyl-CoA-carboxylase] ligase|nr:BirA family transcriptional regulator [Gammaproteobacteria bacterium]MEA2732946.1 BirA family transcriptional regulator [Acetobacteraceae bacterium]MEA3138933.1 BirA family transcriptional regulator [Gammaproteobacteria bacterium]
MVVSISSGIKLPRLLLLLADGEMHSGEWLAAELRQTRAAVWKGVQRLRVLGIAVQALPRRGYRLQGPVELLDAQRIRAELSPECQSHLHALELLFDVDSTNTRLLAAKPPPSGTADVCLTELQHAGRGRLGRRWIAPFGSGIAMSLGWTCSDVVRTLPALSLGVGVAVSRALARAGAEGTSLKWPNDIWYRDRKLGGVLIELRAEAGGPAHVVIGVGLNVRLPEELRHQIETSGVAVAAVTDACQGRPSRNLLAGAILDELLSMLLQYERFGFPAFRDAWIALDGLKDRQAQVVVGGTTIAGIARGVDSDGALLLETGDGMQRFVSGEASLRLAHG